VGREAVTAESRPRWVISTRPVFAYRSMSALTSDLGVGAATEGALRLVMRLRFKLSHWGASNHAL